MIAYFFYGSNMCLPFLQQMGVRFGKYQKAVLHNYRFTVNVPDENPQFGYANVILQNNYKVDGLWIEINEDDVAILDAYENFPHDYLKKQVSVWVENKELSSTIYYGNPAICVDKNLKLNEEQLYRINWIKKEDFWNLS